MLHVDDYLQIRLLHRDGLRIRQIAKRLGHSRETVKKALIQPAPLPYTRTAPAACPKLGAFIGRIEQIHVDFPKGRRAVPVLLAVWSYSHMPFAITLPDQTTGSILHGMDCALEL